MNSTTTNKDSIDKVLRLKHLVETCGEIMFHNDLLDDIGSEDIDMLEAKVFVLLVERQTHLEKQRNKFAFLAACLGGVQIAQTIIEIIRVTS